MVLPERSYQLTFKYFIDVKFYKMMISRTMTKNQWAFIVCKPVPEVRIRIY